MTKAVAMTPAREFISNIQYWGQQQSTTLLLDLVCCLTALYISKSFAIKILAVGSMLKGSNILWLYFGAAYTSDYSEGFVGFLTIMLELGWFCLDHIASVSTFHRTVLLYKHSPARYAFTSLLSLSLLAGFGLRILRSSCRFGACWSNPTVQPWEESLVLDSAIAANVIVTEYVLLFGLLFKCVESMYQMKPNANPELKAVLGVVIQESWLRVAICGPLGLMEILGYSLPGTTTLPLPLNWFFQAGIYSRQLVPTLLTLMVLAARDKKRFVQSVESRSPQVSKRTVVKNPAVKMGSMVKTGMMDGYLGANATNSMIAES